MTTFQSGDSEYALNDLGLQAPMKMKYHCPSCMSAHNSQIPCFSWYESMGTHCNGRYCSTRFQTLLLLMLHSMCSQYSHHHQLFSRILECAYVNELCHNISNFSKVSDVADYMVNISHLIHISRYSPHH